MLPLFQFWNKPTAPAEVEALMKTWADDPNFSYRRYDTNTAGEFISEHFNDRARAAFDKCAIPAMQADFFRYCALLQEGGVYVDADTANGGTLSALVAPQPRGLFMMREDRVANDFLFVRHPGEELLEYTLAQAILNVENQISSNVWLVTGPGIMTSLHKDPETIGLFGGMGIVPVSQISKAVLFKHDLDYKSSADDWRQYLRSDPSAIFVA